MEHFTHLSPTCQANSTTSTTPSILISTPPRHYATTSISLLESGNRSVFSSPPASPLTWAMDECIGRFTSDTIPRSFVRHPSEDARGRAEVFHNYSTNKARSLENRGRMMEMPTNTVIDTRLSHRLLSVASEQEAHIPRKHKNRAYIELMSAYFELQS
jgi:hypothetical protein